MHILQSPIHFHTLIRCLFRFEERKKCCTAFPLLLQISTTSNSCHDLLLMFTDASFFRHSGISSDDSHFSDSFDSFCFGSSVGDVLTNLEMCWLGIKRSCIRYSTKFETNISMKLMITLRVLLYTRTGNIYHTILNTVSFGT